jgi:hypothetical protein
MKSSIFALALFAGLMGVSQSSQAGSERRGNDGDFDHRDYNHYSDDHRDYDRDDRREHGWDDSYWHYHHFGYWRHHRGYWKDQDGRHIFVITD